MAIDKAFTQIVGIRTLLRSRDWRTAANRAEIEFRLSKLELAMLAATPQPEGDGWIKCSDIEPDLFWDYDNPEDSGHESEYELADYCASDMPADETMVVDVMCAKRIPNRKMKIWIDENDDLQWEWVSPQPPVEQEGKPRQRSSEQ